MLSIILSTLYHILCRCSIVKTINFQRWWSTDHTAYKAGGNELAQLGVVEKGIVTTSEKYTIAHSNHVGLKFVALKWQNLDMKIDVGDTSSEDYNYRSNEERYSGRRWWQDLSTEQLLSCIISYIRPKQESESDFSRDNLDTLLIKKARLPQSDSFTCFRNPGVVNFIALRCNCILLEDFFDVRFSNLTSWLVLLLVSLTLIEPLCISLQFCCCLTAYWKNCVPWFNGGLGSI